MIVINAELPLCIVYYSSSIMQNKATVSVHATVSVQSLAGTVLEFLSFIHFKSRICTQNINK